MVIVLTASKLFSPEAGVISAGLDNSYSHPSTEALALYESVGANIYRTDESGTVVVTASANGTYRVRATPSVTASAVPAREDVGQPSANSSLPFDLQGQTGTVATFLPSVRRKHFTKQRGRTIRTG